MLGDVKQFEPKSSKPVFILGTEPNCDPVSNLMFACTGARAGSSICCIPARCLPLGALPAGLCSGCGLRGQWGLLRASSAQSRAGVAGAVRARLLAEMHLSDVVN